MKEINPKQPKKFEVVKLQLRNVLSKKTKIMSEQVAEQLERVWFGEAGRLMCTVGLFVIVIVNFNTMFDGVFQELERSAEVGDQNVLLACIITGTTAILIFLAWYALYSYASRCLTSWARKIAYLYSFVLLLITFIISSTPTFMGITHQITRPMHMFDMTTEAAEMINIITDSSRNAKAVVPTLEGLKGESCSSRDLEGNTGIISRTGRGVGPATGAFNSACSGSSAVLESIQKSIVKANQSADQINKTLEDLFVLVDDRHIAVLEREDGFKKAMASLDRLIRQFHNEGLGKAVESGVVTLKSLVPFVPKEAGMNKGARTAINGIHAKLDNAANELGKIVATTDGKPLQSVKYRATLTEITFRYMERFPVHIGMSMFLDFYPFFIFWALILYHAKPPTNEDDQYFDDLDLKTDFPDAVFKMEDV